MGRMNEDEMSMMCEWDLCDFPGFVLEVNLEKALDSSRPFGLCCGRIAGWHT